MTDVAPIRREIIVATTVARAFELFTARIGDWWPISGFSVFGDGTVSFEGDELVERSGERAACGPVAVIDHPLTVARLRRAVRGTAPLAAVADHG